MHYLIHRSVGSAAVGTTIRAFSAVGGVSSSQPKMPLLHLCAAACILTLLAGCASTKVKTDYQNITLLPRPEQVFVYNLAVSPEEVELTSGLAADLVELTKKAPRTDQEKAIGHAVADLLAKKLVADIKATGFATFRAAGPPPATSSTLTIKGGFISIDEGNSTEREVIGLGLGRTKVKAMIQVYDCRGGQPPLLVRSFGVDAAGGRKPGMAESMGAGALTGHLAAAAAVGVGGAVVSEEWTGTVDADVTRMSKAITKKLQDYFAGQGWMVQY